MTFALTSPSPDGHDDCGAAFWPTPPGVVRAILDEEPPPKGWVIDACAGEGAISRVVLERPGYHVEAVELRKECRPALEELLGGKDSIHRVVVKDWRAYSPPPMVSIAIIGNPPYNPAPLMYQCVTTALALKPTWLGLLLPLGFGAAESRAHLLEAHPPAAIRPLVPRPSFCESGEGGKRDVAWYVWRRGDTAARFAPLRWRHLQ